MTTLTADLVSYDFAFTPCEPCTPPSLSFDPSLLELPAHPRHARSSSYGSTCSIRSSPSDSVATASTRRTTPSRSPIRTHGPLLLPKIRSQDQAIGASPSVIAGSPPKRAKTSPAPAVVPSRTRRAAASRPSHARSFTNPEAISFSSALFGDDQGPGPTLLCSPVTFAAPGPAACVEPTRRASSCGLDDVAVERYGFPTYRQRPAYLTSPAAAASTAASSSSLFVHAPMATLGSNLAGASQLSDPFLYQPFAPREPSPLAVVPALTPEPEPTTTLLEYLTAPNPAPSLVRTISFPFRDPHTKHFWWDVRQVRPWSSFSAETVKSLPGADAMLTCPLPAVLLPMPAMAAQRHPETESALHSIYAGHYLPRLNTALAASSPRPLQLTVPVKTGSAAAAAASAASAGMNADCMFVANVAGEPASAAAIFGGKPTARVVGLVKSFDRFNTGMRVEGNIKRVEYLRGLAHLHHAMREHGCRYGFILTEIELVVVRNGAEATPHFGYLEVASIQLAAAGIAGTEGSDGGATASLEETPLTACLALWGLCMLADDQPVAGHAHWRAEIGAPAEGTRRKALARDDWMPLPQLAEKREAKRARGWVFPDDPVGRKELGKRGVRYAAC